MPGPTHMLGSTQRILLVEDHLPDARFVELLLEGNAHIRCTIDHVQNYRAVEERLDQGKIYDAILLDLSLPDSAGFETLKKLFLKYSRQIVIVMTGLSDRTLGIEAVKMGAQDFLVKGDFDAASLGKTLRFAIERGQVTNRLEHTQRIARIANWTFSPSTGKFSTSLNLFDLIQDRGHTSPLYVTDLPQGHPILSLVAHVSDMTIGTTYTKDVEIEIGNELNLNFALEANAVEVDGVEYIEGYIQDISERKQAERQMLKSQARYRKIYDQASDAIILVQFDGIIVELNHSAANIFGCKSGECVGTNFFDRIRPAEVSNHIQQQLAIGKPVKEVEVEVSSTNEQLRYCQLSVNTVFKDEFDGYTFFMRDITEKKEAEELQKTREMERETAKLKEKFIAGISHEMRTPMNAIVGMANLLKGTSTTSEQDNYLLAIRQSSNLLLGIINDILEISTLQNGKILYENKNFDIHQLFAELSNVLCPKAAEKNLAFAVDVDEDIPRYVKGDSLRINQVLFNLVGNAIKFTDKGQITVRAIKVGRTQDSIFVKFSVQDTGMGIPKDKQSLIFESFTRIKSPDRNYEGTGLGLSIAKNLVEQQGGRIWLESEPGIGSTFYFDMIFDIGNAEDMAKPVDNYSDSMVEPDAILIVEDNKLNQIVAKKTILRKWPNIKVDLAENGQIALAFLDKSTYDIVLMDLHMPVMDGYATTEAIRAHPDPVISNIPILAMTADAQISLEGKFLEKGMNSYVLKPFEPEQLYQQITQFLPTR